jgi:hypothetical protein
MSILLNIDSSTLNQNLMSDNFRVAFSQAINLPGEWECALLQAKLWYSWYNISAEKGNNILRYSTDSGATWNVVTVPDGQYEIYQLDDYLHSVMKANGDFFINASGQEDYNIDIVPNFSTLKVMVNIISGSNYQLDLSQSLIYLLLGFTAIVVTASQSGANLANINDDINSLSIESDIVTGSFSNGLSGGVMYTFVPQTSPGANIFIDITNPIYIPISSNRIQSINMQIKDNLSRRVNLNGQPTTYLLHIRKMRDNSKTNELLEAILRK